LPFSILVVLNTITAYFCSLFGGSAVAAEVARCLRPNRFLEAFVGLLVFIAQALEFATLQVCRKLPSQEQVARQLLYEAFKLQRDQAGVHRAG
jgi:hypothetical protein